jgi:hypothetical protein
MGTPLSQPGVEALSRAAMASQLRKSRVRAAQLADRAGDGYALSPLEWDDLAHAEDLMAGLPRLIGGE